MLDAKDVLNIEYKLEEYFMTSEDYPTADVIDDPVFLFANAPDILEQYKAIIQSAGRRIFGLTNLIGARKACENQIHASVTFVHIDDFDPDTKASLKEIEAVCATRNIPLVIILHVKFLDDVMAELSYGKVKHILLNDNDRQNQDLSAEMIFSLPRESGRVSSLVAENDIDSNEQRLRKISSDIDHIVRALAKLSEPRPPIDGRKTEKSAFFDPPPNQEVADTPIFYKAQKTAPIEAYEATIINDSEKSKDVVKSSLMISAKQVRGLIKARRLRDQYFTSDLFADPAWDMLLDLLAARMEEKNITVSSLCIAANVPPTTALRWISVMTNQGIFERQADLEDKRRVYIELSDDATASLIGMFSTLKKKGWILI